MPRKPRSLQTSRYYHIMSQGINKEYIFKREKYINKYRELMKEKKKDIEINILSYCIMSNHVHILIYSKDIKNISKYMQKLNTSYSNYYNKVKKRVGYVFRDRFLSQEILGHRQLLNCIKYIHFNPVKAGMVRKVNEYKYSSFNEFFEEKYILDEKSIELIFEEKENREKKFFELHDSGYIEDDFLDVKDKDISEFMKAIKEKYKVNDLTQNKKMLEIIIKKARRETDVTIRQLAEILDISKSTISNYEKK